jgi:hypothetical protein
MGVELACFHLARMLDLDLARYSQGENLSERPGDSNLMGHQAMRCNALGAVKKSELTEAAVFPLTPGPSPRWGEGKVY